MTPGFPKKGTHSVGVARQYCGQLGKQDNCQIAVSLSVANDHASLPIAYRLYLPETWANDRRSAGQGRRAGGCRVPHQAGDRPRPDPSGAGRRRAAGRGAGRRRLRHRHGLPHGLTEMGLTYVVGIQSSTSLWPPGTGRCRPKPGAGAVVRPRSCAAIPSTSRSRPRNWRRPCRRAPGTSSPGGKALNAPLASRFAAVRVRPAHRDYWRSAPRPEEWFLIEWPQGESEPTKYWLSTLPRRHALADLVDQAKLRWRIERDYQELKQEIGLGHYEGRGWRGFHHHATLAIAAYGFLVSERSPIPPSGQRSAPLLKAPRLPKGYRPRGAAAPTRTPRRQLDRHHPR